MVSKSYNNEVPPDFFVNTCKMYTQIEINVHIRTAQLHTYIQNLDI